MPGKQSNGSDRNLGVCSFLFTSGDISLWVWVQVVAQMSSDCPCLSSEATSIGMASGTLEVYPISRFVAIGMGTHNSLGEGKYSPQVWHQGPEHVGCVGQNCLDRCLNTQTRLMFRIIRMAGLIYRPWGEPFGIWKKGECEALTHVFVSGYRVTHSREISGWLHGKWTSPTLWGFGPVQVFWVILWDGRSPFFCCFCFVF